MRLLLVDDDPEIVALIPLLLPHFAFQHAVSGEEALHCLREERPDLVLLDWMMPGMDGLQVLQRMRADLTLAAIPVIMVSANAQKSQIQAGLEAGANGYLLKPFTSQDLRQIVLELLPQEGVDDEQK